MRKFEPRAVILNRVTIYKPGEMRCWKEGEIVEHDVNCRVKITLLPTVTVL